MKKFVSILTAAALVLGLTACAPKTQNNQPTTTSQTTAPNTQQTTQPATTQQNTTQPNSVIYKDGSFKGEGDKWEYGFEDATVEIASGKMKSIVLRRLDKDGKEVNYDQFAGQEKEGKKYPNLKQFRVDMANKMIEKQSYNVDTISGATVSTKNWKLAVQRALEKAKK